MGEAVKRYEDARKEMFEELLAYAELLANDYLMLSGWIVNVSTASPMIDGARASMGSTNGAFTAHIYMAVNWWKEPADDIRTAIVHELCHLFIEQGWEYARVAMPAAEYKAFCFLMEYGVASMTRVIAPNMPLPEFSWYDKRTNGAKGKK